MKKIISMMFAVILAIVALPCVAIANDETHVLGNASLVIETSIDSEDISDDYIHPGASIDVAIKGDISNIASMIFSVDFQCEGAEISEPDLTKNTMGGNLFYNEQNGLFIWLASNFATEINNQGVFATFSVTLPDIENKEQKEFVASATIIEASTQYEDFSDEYITKTDDEKTLLISHFWNSGEVQADGTVKYTCLKSDCNKTYTGGGLILGDVDNNGKIEAADITALARHVAKINIIENNNILEQCCDTTHDKNVTAEDITRLARYVAKIINEL